jgi:hypothetical protein
MSWTSAFLFIFLIILAIPGAWLCLAALCVAFVDLDAMADEQYAPDEPILKSLS